MMPTLTIPALSTLMATPPQDSKPDTAEFEPEDEWKQQTMKKIEEGLLSMLKETKRTQAAELRKDGASLERRIQLEEDYIKGISTVKALATDQFNIELDTERQRRKWVAEMPVSPSSSGEALQHEHRRIVEGIIRSSSQDGQNSPSDDRRTAISAWAMKTSVSFDSTSSPIALSPSSRPSQTLNTIGSKQEEIYPNQLSASPKDPVHNPKATHRTPLSETFQHLPPAYELPLENAPPKLSPSPSHQPHQLGLEPDGEWKRQLKERVEQDLQVNILDVKERQAVELRKGVISLEARNRLEQQYKQDMNIVKTLANDQYRIELDRERQRRRWLLGMPVHPDWLHTFQDEQRSVEATVPNQQGHGGSVPSHSSTSASPISSAENEGIGNREDEIQDLKAALREKADAFLRASEIILNQLEYQDESWLRMIAENIGNDVVEFVRLNGNLDTANTMAPKQRD